MKKITLLLLTFILLVSCSEMDAKEKDVEEGPNEALEIEQAEEINQDVEEVSNS